MMKTIILTLATFSALAMTTPLAAQTWHGDHSQSRAWYNGGPVVAELRLQLDRGIARGTITGREATMLRIDLNALARLERIYDRDGISRSEAATLVRRGAGLRRLIQRAETNGSRGQAGIARVGDR